MRIQGPQDPRIPESSVSPAHSGQPSPGAHPGKAGTVGTAQNLSAAGRVPDIPPEQMRALVAELSAAGIDRSTLDPASLYRALLLYRHGLPLTRAAITLDITDIPPVLHEAVMMLGEAQQTLEMGNLSIQDRTLVTALASDLGALLMPGAESGSTAVFYGSIIEEWAADTELRMLSLLATGSTDESTTGNMSGAGRWLLSPDMLERLGAPVAELVAGFRTAVTQLQAAVLGMDPAAADAMEQLQAAVARFTSTLSSLSTFLEVNAAVGGAEQLVSAVKSLFDRQIAALDEQYHAYIPEHGSSAGIGQPAGSVAFIQKSGLMFEWRLFSWYIAGGNPERLRQLMQHDMKGVLLSFLSGLHGRKKPPAKNSPVSHLEQHAHSLINRIGTQQLATLAGQSDPEQPVFFELPFAGQPESGQARIKMSSEETGAVEVRQRELVFSFAVETTVLGEVTAAMRISGNAISIEFDLSRDEWAKLGESQVAEIREHLQERGFAVGEVIFRQRTALDDRALSNGGA